MRPYRGWTKEGKEVKGWYCEVDDHHYIILDAAEMKPIDPDMGGWGQAISGFVEVDPETVSQSVCTDKNGKDVFMNSPITALCPDMSNARIKGCIVPNQSPLSCLMFKYSGGLYPAPDLKDIELIKEKG